MNLRFNFVFVLTLYSCLMTKTFSQTNHASSAVRIEWTNPTNILFSYELRPVESNHIEVVLIVGQTTISSRTARLTSDQGSLIRLAKKAFEEMERNRQAIVASNVPEMQYRLTMRLSNNGDQEATSLEGGLSRLTRMFQESIELRQILSLCSSGQPKAYRLIDESGPMKQMLRPPATKK